MTINTKAHFMVLHYIIFKGVHNTYTRAGNKYNI